MKPLSIVAYFDGRPGHEKQTRSILKAMADMTPTEVVKVKVVVSPAAYVKNWGSYFLSSLFPIFLRGTNTARDLIIGSGSHTHVPMLLTRKALENSFGSRARVVTCMTPEPLLFNRFDLCCIPAHDEPPSRDNVFVTFGPPCPLAAGKKHDPGRGLILIGGVDKKSHRWQTAKNLEQVRTIIDKSPDVQWTLSSSPRTPEETCRQLAAMAAAGQNLKFFRAENTPPGWIEAQYAINQKVWVTADSISMVYEAITGGCSVGILPVEWLRPENKFQKSLDILREQKMIVTYGEWRNGAPMPAPPPEPFNESARCAREILRRWWPERLP